MSKHTLWLLADQGAPDHKTDSVSKDSEMLNINYTVILKAQVLCDNLLLVNTEVKPQLPGGGEETPTNIEGQPISMCSMRIRSDLAFILRICDIKKETERPAETVCIISLTMDETSAADMTALTDKWISF